MDGCWLIPISVGLRPSLEERILPTPEALPEVGPPVEAPELPPLTPREREKRKFVTIDRRTQLSSEAMRELIENPEEILRELRVAPNTRTAMTRYIYMHHSRKNGDTYTYTIHSFRVRTQ
jgi:hypothetical protein